MRDMRRSHSHLASLRTQPSAEAAKPLRSRMTDAEKRLWYYLRGHRLEGWSFRRQVPLGPYVADFLCESARLIVEADGGQHAERASHDQERSAWLQREGYAVLRFWNNDVLANTEGVLGAILTGLRKRRWRVRA